MLDGAAHEVAAAQELVGLIEAAALAQERANTRGGDALPSRDQKWALLDLEAVRGTELAQKRRGTRTADPEAEVGAHVDGNGPGKRAEYVADERLGLGVRELAREREHDDVTHAQGTQALHAVGDREEPRLRVTIEELRRVGVKRHGKAGDAPALRIRARLGDERAVAAVHAVKGADGQHGLLRLRSRREAALPYGQAGGAPVHEEGRVDQGGSLVT